MPLLPTGAMGLVAEGVEAVAADKVAPVLQALPCMVVVAPELKAVGALSAIFGTRMTAPQAV